MNIDLLKNQHKNFRQLISEIEETLNTGDVSGKAFDISFLERTVS